MFDKLLIANRGEIACRITETARKMGITTVAVFSDADATARHVEIADEAIHIGPAAPAESYLRGEVIIDAAVRSGAGAIHPGYGFLSENPDFVEAVETAGLIFVGPSASAIRSMGLKDAAKSLMAAAGVPIVPGCLGADQSPETLETEAKKIGYPILIKAVAGGGGKGMRRVDAPREFQAALASAKAEARTAFGNDAVLIEKYIPTPRHIEFQIFGDGTQAVHLFERDCSLQRRHQKVIEEAPAPGMTCEMRDAMGAAAVRAAQAVGYASAGTVEFIVDASDGLQPDKFWFMEMNTRLQVEHPVTEAITGIDLVEWQLKVAMGQPLPATQNDLTITGHAIEARLYAEDPTVGFLPAIGTLQHLHLPTDVRIDTGVRSGDAISPYYDPMIAKLTVHEADRAAALSALGRVLRKTQIAGTTTNLDFLGKLVSNPAFQAGQLDTGIIQRSLDELTAVTKPSEQALAVAATAALTMEKAPFQGFTLWSGLRRHVAFADCSVALTPSSQGAMVEIGGQAFGVRQAADGWYLDGNKTAFSSFSASNTVHIFGSGGGVFHVTDPLDRQVSDIQNNTVLAPMPGRITAVHVTQGSAVAKGDPLISMEAMKMEHEMRATSDGIVSQVPANIGDQVKAGTALVLFQSVEEALNE